MSRNDDIIAGLGDKDKGAKGSWWSQLGSSKPPPDVDMNVGSTLGKSTVTAAAVGIIVISCCMRFTFLESLELEDDADGAEEEDPPEPPAQLCLFLRQPPPTGTLRRVPPCVQ